MANKSVTWQVRGRKEKSPAFWKGFEAALQIVMDGVLCSDDVDDALLNDLLKDARMRLAGVEAQRAAMIAKKPFAYEHPDY